MYQGMCLAGLNARFQGEMLMLNGKRVAILVTEGFEQSEMTEPRQALEQAGASTVLVSPAAGEVQGWKHFDKADRFHVDESLDEAKPESFDALVLPGGVANPDQLRANPQAVEFVRHFVDASKPIGAICHGPWTLIEAGGVSGRRITSWPSLRTDLQNAGAQWTDEEVVIDGPLVSSRKPADIPAFNKAIVQQIERGAAA